ncbi:GTPase Era, mitochondrial [Aethina tumida]|uniref:GTPase Era, mitochondrial n=1 Tax=Aethina tumida TaxID=116153 RepID=UPI0021492E85|nr:GTPase Era, mitochondrial [Aethina tumida]
MFFKILTQHNIQILQLTQKRLCTTEVQQLVNSTIVNPERLLKVAIIGKPNAGKSTFINHLMDRKVCPTSRRVHTTRHKSSAIFTSDDAQIVFLDTPGLVNDRELKKFNLEKSFTKDCKSSLQEADIIGVIHDASDAYTREVLDIKVIKSLESHKNTPSFLVLNKVDLLKSKRKLLDLTRLLTENCLDGKPNSKMSTKIKTDKRGWPYFKDIFMVSSLMGNGIREVKNYLINQAKPNKWLFPPEMWTNEAPESLIIKAVQAQLLNFLPQEIPYILKPTLEFYEVNETGKISCVVLVKAPSERVSKLVAGAGDGRLRQITEIVQNDLQLAFKNYVRIQIVMDYPNKED